MTRVRIGVTIIQICRHGLRAKKPRTAIGSVAVGPINGPYKERGRDDENRRGSKSARYSGIDTRMR